VDRAQRAWERGRSHRVARGASGRRALKLLLDEMLSPAIARALRERGHDVEAVKEHPDWEALSDPELVSLAVSERRATVTNNLRDSGRCTRS
jgi:uncharacterized protein with PIN domain